MSPTSRTFSPTIRAASYIVGARASPSPLSKSLRNKVVTDWVHDSEPLARRTNTRSPGWTKQCILLTVLTWSYPALVRESDAITSPYFVAIPTQYVICQTPFQSALRTYYQTGPASATHAAQSFCQLTIRPTNR